MNITVRYQPDLLETIRLNLYLQRRSVWGYWAFGVLMIVLGVTWHKYAYAQFFFVLGVGLIIGAPLVVCWWVYRYRQNVLAETTLTNEGVQRRTENYTIHLTWDKVNRVRQLKHTWIFIADGRALIAVSKQRLSQEQQAELADFVAGQTQTNAP